MKRIIGNVNTNKLMYQAVDIILGTTSGKTMFQNLTQLQNATIVRMSIIPPKMASYSSQTYNSNIPTLADYKNMFFTFMRGDTNILENVAALVLNPFLDSDGAAATTANSNPFWDKLFTPQIIDFNKSYVWMAANPSAANLVVSIGVSYFYEK